MKLTQKRPKVQAKLKAFSDSDEEEDTAAPKPASSQENEQTALNLKTSGQSYAEQQQWGKALGAWDQALALNSSISPQLYELRAQVLMELGRDFEAVQSASKATALSPAFVEGFLTLARAQLNLGEPMLALKSFQRVLQLQPDHSEAKDELAVVQMLSIQQSRAGAGRRAVVQPQLQGPFPSAGMKRQSEHQQPGGEG